MVGSEVDGEAYLVHSFCAGGGTVGGQEVDEDLPRDAAGDDVAPNGGQTGVAQSQAQLETAVEVGLFRIICAAAESIYLIGEAEHWCEVKVEVVGEYSDLSVLWTVLQFERQGEICLTDEGYRVVDGVVGVEDEAVVVEQHVVGQLLEIEPYAELGFEAPAVGHGYFEPAPQYVE